MAAPVGPLSARAVRPVPRPMAIPVTAVALRLRTLSRARALAVPVVTVLALRLLAPLRALLARSRRVTVEVAHGQL